MQRPKEKGQNKRQTTMYKTQHRTLKIVHHEPHKNTRQDTKDRAS